MGLKFVRHILLSSGLAILSSNAASAQVSTGSIVTDLWNFQGGGVDLLGPMAVNDGGLVVGVGLLGFPINSPTPIIYSSTSRGPWYLNPADLTKRPMNPMSYLDLPSVALQNRWQQQDPAYRENNQFGYPLPPVSVQPPPMPPFACPSCFGAGGYFEDWDNSELYYRMDLVNDSGALAVNNLGTAVGYLGQTVPSYFFNFYPQLGNFLLFGYSGQQMIGARWRNISTGAQPIPLGLRTFGSSDKTQLVGINDREFAVGYQKVGTLTSGVVRNLNNASQTRTFPESDSPVRTRAIRPTAISQEGTAGTFANMTYVVGEAKFGADERRRAFACAINRRNLSITNFCPLNNLGVLGTDSTLASSYATAVQVPYCSTNTPVAVGRSRATDVAVSRAFACKLTTTGACQQKAELPPFNNNNTANPEKFSEARAINKAGVIVGRAARESGGSAVDYAAVWTTATTSSGYRIWDLLSDPNIRVPDPNPNLPLCGHPTCPANLVWSRLIAFNGINNRNDIVGVGQKIGDTQRIYGFIIKADRAPVVACAMLPDECLVKMQSIAAEEYESVRVTLARIYGISPSSLPTLPLSDESLARFGFAGRRAYVVQQVLLELRVPYSPPRDPVLLDLFQVYMYSMRYRRGGEDALKERFDAYEKAMIHLADQMRVPVDSILGKLADPYESISYKILRNSPPIQPVDPILPIVDFAIKYAEENGLELLDSQIQTIKSNESIWTVSQLSVSQENRCKVMRRP